MRESGELFATPDAATVSVIAEAGVNHNGDVDLAHQLIDVAVRSGAAAVKFQTFDPVALTAPSAALTPYQQQRSAQASQAAMLRDLMLPRSAWRELKSHADDAGLRFLSTPFDLASAEFLVDLGVDALKLSSGELTNLPFLRAVSGLGLPLMLSTGMGDLAEVTGAVEACASAPRLALFHCVSAYPAPPAQCNLRAIPAMAETLGLPIGWSDHTLGTSSALVAVALGARLLEKHFTISRALPGPDHPASLEPDEMTEYVELAQLASDLLGDGIKRRMPAEEENAPLVRRSWHAARDLAAGTLLGPDDVVTLRPEHGLSPTVDLMGRALSRAIGAGQPITQDHLA